MIICRGGTQQGSASRRFARVIHLGEALRELMNLYARHGRVQDAVVTQIERDIEGCLAHTDAERGAVQNRLGVLYRVRDLHRFVMDDPAWTTLRHRMLETLLFHPTPVTRWAALREMLAEDILAMSSAGAQPGTRLLEGGVDPESFKLAVSDRHGPLGTLLTALALFNLDAVDESPPDNLLLRLIPGRFPRHTWEVLASRGGAAKTGNLGTWQPATPLCRYEYLAADLLHALLRRGSPHAALGGTYATPAGPTRSGEPYSEAGSGGITRPGTPGPVTCRLEAGRDDPEGTQLELLPLDPRAFPAELLRLAHRRHGPEGVRLLALVLAHFHRRGPEAATVLRLGDIAAGAALHDLSARGVQTRLRRLHKIIALLEGVELTRLREVDGRTLVQRNRLLTVLGLTEEQRSPEASLPARSNKKRTPPRAAAPDDGDNTAKDAPPTEMVVATDSLMHGVPAQSGQGEPGLAARFGNLPQDLVDLADKGHPCLLPLYVLLRGAWGDAGMKQSNERDAPHDPQPLEHSAAGLLQEAGVWISETGRYRTLEALRRDLDTLVEHGWLGGWRMKRNQGRGAVRDAMEDRIVLTPPGMGARGGNPQPGMTPVEVLGG